MLLDVLVRLGADPRARRGVRDLEAEPAVGEREDVRDGRPAPPGVGDDDDLELEPLRGVDREQAHGVGALLLRDRVRLLGADGLLPGDEADEALEVGAAELLVRAGEARELAEVRVAPLCRRGGRARRGRSRARRGSARRGARAARAPASSSEPVVALPEREQQAPVVLGEVAGQRPLDAAEDRLPLRVRPDQDERVVRDADERRREHGEQRLVVVAVVQQPQVGEQVDDLLLAEVVAARGAVRRQADGAELLLEPLGVGAGGEEEHDLARGRVARVDELADAPRDVARLGPAPVDAGLARRRLVRDEQLERGPKRRTPRRSAGSSGWNSSPNSAAKSSFTAASTSGRER